MEMHSYATSARFNSFATEHSQYGCLISPYLRALIEPFCRPAQKQKPVALEYHPFLFKMQ